MSIRLGQFNLHAPLGEGGMGIVWRAVFPVRDQPLAIKVLTGKAARTPRFIEDFRAEARVVASLDQPNIVSVYDYGLVDEDAFESSNGRLPLGSPFLVMELLAGGSLRGLCGRTTWPRIRGVLKALLEALAHAHARGVIHRDLKPENVLLGENGRAVLTDFGIAHLLEEDDPKSKLLAGTPAYMAPEQIDDRFGDYGPWTDLYSLGCLAYNLVSGRPPFSGLKSKSEYLEAHLRRKPPPLEARMPVPSGLSEWIEQLLEKRPGARCRRAADAAHALMLLGAPDSKHEGYDVAFNSFDPASDSSQELTEIDELVSVDRLPISSSIATERMTTKVIELQPAPAPEQFSCSAKSASAMPPPPFPGNWRQPNSNRTALPVDGMGLGLYGFRRAPLVGREKERDELWHQLGLVHSDGVARTVILRGPCGYGKSRLASWLAERSHETGSTIVLQASHGPIGGPADGLAGMLIRHFGLKGTSRKEVRARMSKLFDREEAHLLTSLIFSDQIDADSGMFASPEERYALIRRLIHGLADERPVLLWLDDIQWGLDSIGLALHIMRGRRQWPIPLFLVLTAREESLVEQPAEAKFLAELETLDGVEDMRIGPLTAEEHSALVRGLLGLTGELAARLESRTSGNPMFAEQLVGHWIERGVLEAAPNGFRLAAGADPQLPDNLEEVWASRIDRLLEALPSSDARTLELAAILGQEVDTAEWMAVCERAGVYPSEDLLDLFMEARLTAPTTEGMGWSFVHGMVREAFESRARAAGRLAAYHRHCANYLEESSEARALERRGLHLLAAEDFERAIEPLTKAARHHLLTGDARESSVVIAARDEALRRLGLEDLDPRKIEGWILKAQRERLAGKCEDAHHWASRAARASARANWRAGLAQALVERARARRERGHLDDAWDHLATAAEVASEAEELEILCRCHKEMGWIRLHGGRLAEARDSFSKALALAQELSSETELAECNYGLGWVAMQQDDLTLAAAFLERGQSLYKKVGSRIGEARCINSLGDAARLRGELLQAEHWCRLALDRYRALGHVSIVIPMVNLGLVLLEQGLFQRAHDILGEAWNAAERERRDLMKVAILACQLGAYTGLGDYAACDLTLGHLKAACKRWTFFHLDIARTLESAARRLESVGESSLARRTWMLARDQWQALDRQKEAAMAEQHLEALF